MEGLVSSLLNDYLGAFIEGLDSSQLQLNVWSGKVHLRSLAIKATALDGLQLPLRVLSGRVASLRLEANWRSLTSQPVKVELEGVELTVGPRTSPPAAVDEKEATERQLTEKLRSLDAVQDFRLQAEAEAASLQSSTASYLRRLTDTVIGNVQLDIKGVHVRYVSGEEEGQRSVLGLGVEQLSAFTTNGEWARDFTSGADVGHRLVTLKNLCVYTREEEEKAGEDEDAFPSLLDVLDSDSTRFLLCPLSGSLRMVQQREESASPRFDLTSALPSIDLRLGQRQFRRLLAMGSELSDAQRQLSAAAVQSPSSATLRPLSKEERRRYVQLYKRTLNAMWSPELDAAERAELDALERASSYSSLAQARTFGWWELKKELQGATVRTRQAGKDEAAKSSGGLKGFFGRRTKEVRHEELTEQQREDLYALLEKEEGEEGVASASPEAEQRVALQLEVGLEALTATLLDVNYRPMLNVAAEGARLRLTKPQLKGLTLDMGMQSLRCSEQIVQASLYHQLMDAQPQQPQLSAASSASSPSSSSLSASTPPPPFFRALFESYPVDTACDRRLLVQLSAPIIQLNQPLLAALLTFFHVPPTVDLATFSAWSLQQLDALRTFSTTTLAEALSSHSALDLNVDLTAPVLVVPLDPRVAPGKDGADVLVLNLGHVRLTTELRGKEEAARTLNRVRAAKGDEQVDAETRDALYDLYHLTVSRTSLFLSSQGSRWAQDPFPSFLLDPLDVRVDVRSAISREVNWLPNFRLQGTLERLQLRVSERKLRRLSRFLEAFKEVDTVPSFVQADLLPKEAAMEPQLSPPLRLTVASSSPAVNAVASSASPVSSSAAASAAESLAVLGVDDLADLFHGDRAKAQTVLKALERVGRTDPPQSLHSAPTCCTPLLTSPLCSLCRCRAGRRRLGDLRRGGGVGAAAAAEPQSQAADRTPLRGQRDGPQPGEGGPGGRRPGGGSSHRSGQGGGAAAAEGDLRHPPGTEGGGGPRQ